MAWGGILLSPCPFWIRFFLLNFYKNFQTFSEIELTSIGLIWNPSKLIEPYKKCTKDEIFSCFLSSCQWGLKLFKINSEKTKATNLQLLTYISFLFCLGFFNLILYISKINLTNTYKVLGILVVLTLFRLNGKNKEIRKIALEVHQPTIGNDGNSVISITNYYRGHRLRKDRQNCGLTQIW